MKQSSHLQYFHWPSFFFYAAIKSKKVAVIRPDDDTFKKFFKSVDQKSSQEKIDISLDDLDSITRESDALLVQQKRVQVQKRRLPTKNPIKTLSTRIEIQEEYTEILTGAAEREERRLNIEKCKYLCLMSVYAQGAFRCALVLAFERTRLVFVVVLFLVI